MDGTCAVEGNREATMTAPPEPSVVMSKVWVPVSVPFGMWQPSSRQEDPSAGNVVIAVIDLGPEVRGATSGEPLLTAVGVLT